MRHIPSISLCGHALRQRVASSCIGKSRSHRPQGSVASMNRHKQSRNVGRIVIRSRGTREPAGVRIETAGSRCCSARRRADQRDEPERPVVPSALWSCRIHPQLAALAPDRDHARVRPPSRPKVPASLTRDSYCQHPHPPLGVLLRTTLRIRPPDYPTRFPFGIDDSTTSSGERLQILGPAAVTTR